MLIQKMFTSEIFRTNSIQYNQMPYYMTTNGFSNSTLFTSVLRSLNVYNTPSAVKFIVVTDVFGNLKYLICNIVQQL